MLVGARFLFSHLALVLICACDGPHSDGDAASHITYGPTVKLRGFYSDGFEESSFALCQSPKDQCKIPITWTGSPIGFCWAEFTPTGGESLSRLRAGKSAGPNNVVWLEGEGRISTKVGNFGHLSMYRCQVEINSVYVIDNQIPGEIYEAVPAK